MVHRVLLWLTLLCLTSQRGGDDSYTVYIDPSFTPGRVESVLAALESWQTTVPVTLKPVISKCLGNRAGEICIRTDAGQTHDLCGERAIGCTATGHGGSSVWLDTDSIETPYFQAVVAHEIGHAMGLQHDDPGTLMAPFIQDGAPVPTCSDITQWYEVRGRVLPECPE